MLNAAKVRNAERTRTVQEISCSLERHPVPVIDQAVHRPMTPRPIKTNRRLKSAMMSSQLLCNASPWLAFHEEPLFER